MVTYAGVNGRKSLTNLIGGGKRVVKWSNRGGRSIYRRNAILALHTNKFNHTSQASIRGVCRM